VSWNKPFKNLCQIAYDDWMAEIEHEITPAGHIKAPSRRSCVERILAAWESLPSDIIEKSFEVCAILLPIYGSEDEKTPGAFNREKKVSQPFSLNHNLVFRYIARHACIANYFTYPTFLCKFSFFSVGIGSVHCYHTCAWN